MQSLTIENCNIQIHPSATAGSPLVFLIGETDEGEAVLHETKALTAADFSFAALSGFDWNDALSPWPAPPAFKHGDAFSGNGPAFLRRLTQTILPEILGLLPAPPAYIALAGYSLAGLFAVYSLYESDMFDRVASASGSFWYPGFLDFAEQRAFKRKPTRVYFSLGDREDRTRNAVMQPVRERTEAMVRRFKDMGVDTTFELNPGNHFQAPEKRMAKGIAWLLA